MEETKKALAVLCERVDNIEQVVIDEKKRLNHNLERITARLETHNELLLEACHRADTKPSWGVTFTLSTLVGIVVGLATFLLTH